MFYFEERLNCLLIVFFLALKKCTYFDVLTNLLTCKVLDYNFTCSLFFEVNIIYIGYINYWIY